MPNHEFKHCPRCNTHFECKVGAINECQCASAKLTQAQRDFIGQQYDDCLCITCLHELASEYNQTGHKKHLQSFKQ